MGCRSRDDQSVLLRVVLAEVDGVWSVVPDPGHRLPGRGAWVHRDLGCLDLADRRRAFPRALRRSGSLDLAGLRAVAQDWPRTAPPTRARASRDAVTSGDEARTTVAEVRTTVVETRTTVGYGTTIRQEQHHPSEPEAGQKLMSTR